MKSTWDDVTGNWSLLKNVIQRGFVLQVKMTTGTTRHTSWSVHGEWCNWLIVQNNQHVCVFCRNRTMRSAPTTTPSGWAPLSVGCSGTNPWRRASAGSSSTSKAPIKTVSSQNATCGGGNKNDDFSFVKVAIFSIVSRPFQRDAKNLLYLCKFHNGNPIKSDGLP